MSDMAYLEPKRTLNSRSLNQLHLPCVVATRKNIVSGFYHVIFAIYATMMAKNMKVTWKNIGTENGS